ncbi:hypothetical protein ABN584_14940 [Gloeocapsa sp. BRSZ]
MSTTKKTQPISVRLTEELADWLTTASESTGLDKTQLIRYALTQLQAELQMTKQLRANLATAKQPLNRLATVDAKIDPKRKLPESTQAVLEKLLAA